MPQSGRKANPATVFVEKEAQTPSPQPVLKCTWGLAAWRRWLKGKEREPTASISCN